MRFVLSLMLITSATLAQAQAPLDQALGVLDEFMAAFNEENVERWSNTLHYPHVRFASGTVTVFQDASNFRARPAFERLRATGWRRSAWISRTPTLVSDQKVHLETVFERYNEAGDAIGQYRSLYIVTKIKDTWGIQARSSLAP